MVWSAEFSPNAARDLSVFAKSARLQILERVAWLGKNFNSVSPLPLHGEWNGFYKFRINDYRIIYKINYETQIIRIEYIDHRSKVYKKRK